MRRGVVLPFPPQQHLTPDDHMDLQRFAAAFPGTQIDILIGRDRREIAVLAYAGRQLWIKRAGANLHARDASSGRLLAEAACVGGLLAAVQAALLLGGTIGCNSASEVPQRGYHDLPFAGE
jgi:hypothetical protein